MLASKFFGMYVYIDKFDYLLNNIHNDEIDEEILFIQEKIEKIEENNQIFFKKLQSLIKDDNYQTNSYKIDLNSREVFQNRFDNLSNQLYTLQIKQIAESIWNIKKDLKKNKYLLIFDRSEGIDNLYLDEKDYRDLIKYRDPINSISVYDLFQEKIHSYYNNNNLRETNCKEYNRKRGRKPKKNFSSKNKENDSNRRGRKLKESDKVVIASVVNINYDYCHHCKQRKPFDVMKKCSSSLSNKQIERPLKTFLINNTICVKSKYSIILPRVQKFYNYKLFG